MHSQTTGHDRCFVAGWRFALGGAPVHPAMVRYPGSLDYDALDFIERNLALTPVIELRLQRRRSSGPAAESQRFRSWREPSEVSARHSKRATGFALMIPIRRVNLGLLLE
jgi:hypothetical protein